MTDKPYTTKLGAGQGLIPETKVLLEIWTPGMDTKTLQQVVLDSGVFPNITARRLRNIVVEGFGSRYLVDNERPALFLKQVLRIWKSREINQLLFLYTCRLHQILADYIKAVYWPSYAAGKKQLTPEEGKQFVVRANQDGKTTTNWSENMVERVGGYLNGTCADFGLLDVDRQGVRDILSFEIEERVTLYLAYDLHFSGLGDNNVVSHPDWGLFGLEREDVLNELKRQALKGWFIIQSAGEATRIGWQYATMEEVTDVLTRG